MIAQQTPDVLAGATLFLLHDGHGSTRALLNPVTGQIVEHYAYDA